MRLSCSECDGPVLAICGSRDSRTIAVGTELTNHQAVVMLWCVEPLSLQSDRSSPLMQGYQIGCETSITVL